MRRRGDPAHRVRSPSHTCSILSFRARSATSGLCSHVIHAVTEQPDAHAVPHREPLELLASRRVVDAGVGADAVYVAHYGADGRRAYPQGWPASPCREASVHDEAGARHLRRCGAAEEEQRPSAAAPERAGDDRHLSERRTHLSEPS